MALRAVLRQGAQAARWAATAPATVAPTRSLRTMTFGNEKETVVERSDYPVDKIQKVCGSKRPRTNQVTPLHCTDHPPCSCGIFRASLSICLVDFIPSMFHVLLCEFQRKIVSSGQAKIPTSFRLQQFCCTRVFVHLVPITVPPWGGTQYLCAVLPCHRVFQRVNSSCFYSRWVYHLLACAVALPSLTGH